ncbi:MAG: hypothetical protein K2O95_07335 [Clostridia bacterium]|nr:hypothetical protein [Clostridia bacterium]
MTGGQKFSKSAVDGEVFAKVVDGKLLYAHKISTNTLHSLDTWQRFPSLEEAAKALGAPMPKNVGCPVLDKTHRPINWSKFKGGYYIPFSTLD